MHFGSWAARAAALALVFGGLLAVVAGGSGATAPPAAEASLYQTGVATWYGLDFEGRRTACGQIYRSSEYTAASNTLPCGSVVTVTNADTGDAVTVTITDRGAFTYPIIVDLSIAAFNAIAHTDSGRVRVIITDS